MHDDVLGLAALPHLGRGLALPAHRDQAAQPEDAAHRGRALEHLALLGRQRGDARLHGILHAERELHVRETCRRACSSARRSKSSVDLEDARVVVDAHDLLEQRRVAARENHGLVDELLDLRHVAARREQVLHHRRPPRVAERRQLDDEVAVGAVALPSVAPRQHLGPRDAEDDDGPAQALDEVREQLERVVVRPLQVVEDQNERLGLPCSRRSRGSS